MKKAFMLMSLLGALSFGAVAAQADGCCKGGKCGNCCTKDCHKCTSNCSSSKCCKK